ncbi:MAG: competence damage-inducible protein A [Candidatus Heimdallarchaeota archaeon]|nr:competence damage-inducible protein A [Candidatus Heimdallarchaeota archaeon]MCK4878104.1 competence damage-inducible protein A [Candidatus Heimdallarchaeota archaeon]
MNLPTAEIVCLGNELLIGVTVNTNATFIGDQLTKLGYEVRRITAIRDDVDLAVDYFTELISRKPSLTIITGGLGPTYDDIQLEVLSKATGLELKENYGAIQQIKDYYAKKNLNITKERRKMGFLPEGSEVLKNNVGGAPGCYFKHSDIDFYCLPGVPTEMKDIFTNYIRPSLKEKTKTELYEEKFQVFDCVESELAPFINEIKTNFQNLYIKSHPAYKDKKGVVIHISGTGEKGKEEVAYAKMKLQDAFLSNLSSISIQELKD